MGLAVFAFPLFQSRLVPMLEEVGQKPRKKRLASFTDFNSAFFPTGARRMSNMPWMRENPLPDFSSEALGQPPWWDWSGNGSVPHERGCLRLPSSLCRFSFLGFLDSLFHFHDVLFPCILSAVGGDTFSWPDSTRSECLDHLGMPRADETHAGSQRRPDTVDASGPTNLNITQQRFFSSSARLAQCVKLEPVLEERSEEENHSILCTRHRGEAAPREIRPPIPKVLSKHAVLFYCPCTYIGLLF